MPYNVFSGTLNPTQSINLDPSDSLVIIDQRYRQDRQRSDSIGRTILQTVAQELCKIVLFSELWQISTNFDNFWQNDGKEAKIMRGALTFHLT